MLLSNFFSYVKGEHFSVVGLLVNWRFILRSARLNTRFLLHFPTLCLACVFHNSGLTRHFLISCNEELVLKIYRTDDSKSLVQTICEIVRNRLSSDTTVYCIQFIAWRASIACQISEGAKHKILGSYKSSKQNKRQIAMKKRKSFPELEPVKKKLCGEVLSLLQ